MAYCLAHISVILKFYPMFRTVNDDGSEWRMPKGGYGAFERGIPLSETTHPPISELYHIAYLESSHKILPDIFQVTSEKGISQRLKDIIEFFEPGIHQYFPVTLMRTKKEAFPGSYYLLNVCQICNSLVPEKSNFRVANTPNGMEYWSRVPGLKNYRTIRKSDVEGKHLWREKLYRDDLYMSDDLYAACRKQKIIGINDTVCVKVVDV
jgi:hypothetical protein